LKIIHFTVGVLPENLRKFFKQVQKCYERDSDFQNGLDYLIENAQVLVQNQYLTNHLSEILISFYI